MKSRLSYVPKRGVFETTLQCNLHCRHCGSSAGNARSDELSTSECGSLFRQLADLGMEWLTLSGGEPTMRHDWLELIRSARETGMRVGMFTNALKLDRSAIQQARECGLTAVGLSVDGLSETHDSIRGKDGHFSILENTMALLKELQMPFSVVTTICNDNLDELDDMYSWIEQAGAYGWQVQPGAKMGNLGHNSDMLLSSHQLPLLETKIAALMRRGHLKIYPADSLGYFGPNEKTLRKLSKGGCFGGCGAGIRNIGIECNGNIKGCLSMFAGYNHHGQDYVEGNIRNEPLADIWHRPGAFAYNRQWTKSDLHGFCRTCHYVERCRGGCIARRITDGDAGDNRMCVYRHLMETSQDTEKMAKAAAVFFAASLGGAVAGCDNVDTDTDTMDTDSSKSTDTNTNTDTMDTDSSKSTDTDTYFVDYYGMPIDTDTDTGPGADTDPVAYYDMPLYGVPVDTDTTDTEMDTDTNQMDWYGMPDTDL